MKRSVSVVIPTHDRPAMLREAIASALAQSYRPSEIIVVDNGPRGEAAAIGEEFGSRVSLIRSSEPGPSASRNVGIKRARGDYVAFLDDDDLWHPEKLSVQMEFLSQHGDIAMASCRVASYGDEIRVRKTPWIAGDLYGMLFMESFVPTPTVVVRRDVFDTAGLFDVRYLRAEDYDLWLQNRRRVSDLAPEGAAGLGPQDPRLPERGQDRPEEERHGGAAGTLQSRQGQTPSVRSPDVGPAGLPRQGGGPGGRQARRAAAFPGGSEAHAVQDRAPSGISSGHCFHDWPRLPLCTRVQREGFGRNDISLFWNERRRSPDSCAHAGWGVRRYRPPAVVRRTTERSPGSRSIGTCLRIEKDE